jgi:hypothetical protein
MAFVIPLAKFLERIFWSKTRIPKDACSTITSVASSLPLDTLDFSDVGSHTMKLARGNFCIETE